MRSKCRAIPNSNALPRRASGCRVARLAGIEDWDECVYRGRSAELKVFEFDVGGAEVGEVVVGLLGEPGFGAAAENFGEADGHFKRDAAFPC
jgi:hypothetical protein